MEFEKRCNAIEECYEFMLAYAAQGLASDNGGRSAGQIREFLNSAVNAITGLAESCSSAIEYQGLEQAERYQAFFDVLNRDARDSLAAVELVLAQPSISSQLVDNLNASIHLRALLTDLFLIDELLKTRRQAAYPAVISLGD
jgi:DNA polymerase III delta prime subunit